MDKSYVIVANNTTNLSQQKLATTAVWTRDNPLLRQGEIGLETQGVGVAPKIKVGDGVTRWNALPYTVTGGAGGGSISDGDKGDVVVSGSGATWTLDAAIKSFLLDRANHTGSQPESSVTGLTTDLAAKSGLPTVTTPSTGYTETATTGNITALANTTSGSFTVVLPTAVGNTARLTYKKTDSTANTLTIDGNGSQTIDGGLTAVLTRQYESITLVSNGSNWSIV